MNAQTPAPVVVGVDGSSEAFAAARYAAWEADRRRVGLRLVYAHQPTPMWGPSTVVVDDYAGERDWVRGLLKTASTELSAAHPSLPIDAVVAYGRPAGALVTQSSRACLLVVGTRSFAGVRGRLAGSVAAQVAAHAATPVVVLRSDEPRYTDPAEFTGLPVVVGVDGSEESMRAFWFAADQADARSAQLQAVLVWSVPDITDAALFAPDNAAAVEDTATRLLAEATAGLPQRYPDLPIVRRIIEDRDAISGLCGAARSAGLLVVGSRGNGGFLGLRLGSTVDGLVRNTPAPLAVIRGAAGGK